METAIWSQYQREGSNPPPFPMPFAMPNMNGESGFGVPYTMMGNSFRSGYFNQGDAAGYQKPYRNYQHRNSRWTQIITRVIIVTLITTIIIITGITATIIAEMAADSWRGQDVQQF